MRDEVSGGSVRAGDRALLSHNLAQIAADPLSQIYAVMDGSLFGDVAGKLTAAQIAHRSLYVRAEHALMAGGPWLADFQHFHPSDDDLYQASGDNAVMMRRKVLRRSAERLTQLKRLFDLMPDSRSLVFWVGDQTLDEDQLYQHLRGLNRISLVAEPQGLCKSEIVTFRHGDANVMAQVLPALDAPRYARLFGPAKEIIFTPHENWGGGCQRLLNLPRPLVFDVPRGFLHWDQRVKDKIAAARLGHLRWKMADYLRETAPHHAAAFSDDELRDRAYAFLIEARELGVSHEVAFAKWSYLRLTIISDDFLDRARGFMTDPSLAFSANDRVSLLMKMAIRAMTEDV